MLALFDSIAVNKRLNIYTVCDVNVTYIVVPHICSLNLPFNEASEVFDADPPFLGNEETVLKWLVSNPQMPYTCLNVADIHIKCCANSAYCDACSSMICILFFNH